MPIAPTNLEPPDRVTIRRTLLNRRPPPRSPRRLPGDHRGNSGPRRWFPLLWAVALLAASAPKAVSQDDALAQLRQFRYGADAAALRRIEQRVAGALANPGDRSARQQLAQRLAAILDTDASYEAKQFVCRQLALIGTAEQVPVLARWLTDATFSDMARYALGPIPDPSVDAALRDSLARATGLAQIGLINTLGFRRDQAAVPQLGQLLGSADHAVARAAAAALGRIGGAEAAGLLQGALPNASGEFQLAVADALLACAEGFLAKNDSVPAAAICRELFQPSQPVRIRAGALRGLVAASGTEAVRLALSGLRDADPAIKRAAIGCIQMLPGRDLTRQFAAELPKLSAADQVILLGALADRGDVEALSAVRHAVDSEDARVKNAALAALGKVGDASVVNELFMVAANGSESALALNSLRALRGAGVDEAITAKLSLVPAFVPRPDLLRAQLIRVLADRQAASAVPTLLRTAEEADERVAVESFKALGQVAEPANLPAVLDSLAAAQGDAAREAGEAAAVEVARRIADESKQADPVLAALKAEQRELVRCSLVRVLGGIGNAPALAAVQSALLGGTAAVRDAAIRALADWPNADATEAVLGVFQRTQDATHRILLLRGLVRMMSVESKRTPAQTLAICQQVIQQAHGADETRQALSLLATVNDPQALPLIEPFLKDDAVREEAAMAAVKIAGPIAAAHPDLARQTIQQVLAVSQNASVRQQANAVLQGLEKNEDFITTWQLAGPFFQSGKSAREIFDLPFPPERAGDTSTAWRSVAAQGASPIVDLLALVGGRQRAAYLRTWIHSDQNQNARLELGSDDGVKAWLNGVVVHANNADRGLKAGEDKVPVTLKEGWNVLLLKITQGEGGWAACARLRGPDGRRLEHVRFDAAHQESAPPAR